MRGVVYRRRAWGDIVIYISYTWGRCPCAIYMRVFTIELFTVQSCMLRVSVVAVSSDVVPGQ